ncbi:MULTISPECIES: putative lipid II flippase FtsW [Clostridium]|uniref:Probable peptidoglycan glycosyltransferase FtsW n=1 Tax=Clostridium disporicum TaxID=84024 RepID=A0A174LE61_9CLOT|nr:MULTISPECIES: putative lipid II flippase FtsW [Clostridium]MCD2500570.1 putative lipid II flippase FtsW [Clostridium sp. NSJ-145]MDU6340043.1 putative lipid II flippase FtsW [Clostridium sp.]CUP21211.1 stage V sporulation protein E [Clostridium disporicum]
MSTIDLQKRIKYNKSKKKKKKKTKITIDRDNGVYVAVILLVLIGLLLVFTSSSYYALYEQGDLYFFIKKQAIWAVIGLGFMSFFARVDYHFLRKLTWPLAIGTLGLLVLVLAIGKEINGAKRWLEFGGLSIQPSEIAKYAVVFVLAHVIVKMGKEIKTISKGIVLPLAIGAAFAVLVLAEKNLSITVVIALVTYFMIMVGGANIRVLIGLIPVGFLAGLGLIVIEPYRLERLTTYLNPWADQSDSGYQLVHSLMAIGSGGVTGQGLGNSMQKALYMPEPHNDFIFAILAEEFGLLGCIFVIGLFIFFIISAIKVAMRAKDIYGRLLAIGITLVIAIQAIINIAVVTGSIPVTGVPLPFISTGGTSLLINLVAMGVLLNIAKQGKKSKVDAEDKVRTIK